MAGCIGDEVPKSKSEQPDPYSFSLSNQDEPQALGHKYLPAVCQRTTQQVGIISNNACRRIDLQSLAWDGLRIRRIPDSSTIPSIPSMMDAGVYWEVNNALRFVDSITIWIEQRIKNPSACGLLLDRGREKCGGFIPWTYFGEYKTLSGAKVVAGYLPFTREHLPYVTLTFSIPKVIQGNNFQNIPYGSDIIRRLDEELLPALEQLNMPAVSILEFEIRRVDIGWNWQVGEDLYRYQDFVRTRTFPRRERHDFNNRGGKRPAGIDPHTNGRCFYSASSRATVYSKEEESKHPLASGVLRGEQGYRKPKAVWKLFEITGSKRPRNCRVGDLRMPIVQRALRELLTITGLGNRIASRRTLFDRLKEVFTNLREAADMHRFVLLELEYPGKTNQEAAHLFGCSAETVRRKRKKLRDKDIGAWGDEAYELPGLPIDILDAPTLADGYPGWSVETMLDGESCWKVPHNIFPVSKRIIARSAPIELEVVAADALVSELFCHSTVLVIKPARIALGFDG